MVLDNRVCLGNPMLVFFGGMCHFFWEPQNFIGMFNFDGGCGITNLNIALSADIAPSGRATMNHYVT